MASPRHFLLRTTAGRLLTLGVFCVVVVLVLGEIAAQVIFAQQARGWEAYKNDPSNYVVRAEDPILCFRIKPGFGGVFDGRTIHINKYGVRENTDDLYADRTRIALVGDSVTFCTGISQEQTISARLQELIEPSSEHTKVLNFGSPGYGLPELPTHLRACASIYKPNLVIYLLNPNDFSLRDTVYEGADNGVYRMYVQPILKLPAAIRKFIYRFHKGGGMVSANWYAWMFNGTKATTLPRLLEMRDYCTSIGADFRVLMLPTFTSAEQGGDQVRTMYKEIADYAKANKILFADATEGYAGHLNDWLDKTDHNTVAGCQATAEIIKKQLIDTPPK